MRKPDRAGTPLDDVERAHLRDPADTSHVMYRYEPVSELEGFVRRFWVPVWSVPEGREAPQRVLQYPVCLLVVTPDYARFYGVVPGLSTTTLTGQGWAVGVMLAPSAGHLLTRTEVAAFTGRSVDVREVLGDGAGDALVSSVREAMAGDPHDAVSHRAAMTAYGAALRPFLPVDEEGELVNRVVAFVEDDPHVLRVRQVCEEFGMTERALQRLLRRRLGLTPKWLIQRRRLQEAAERLREPASLAEVSAVLGYADQPHFIRDFARVTGMTPGQFAARHARESPA